MKKFSCACGNTLFFENDHCLNCQRALGFNPETRQMVTLDHPAEGSDTANLALCANGQSFGVCNWLTTEQDGPYCRSCRLNRYVPDLRDPHKVMLWGRLERAKRRMLITLLELGLPLNRGQGPNSLAFEFLSDDGVDPSEGQVGSPVYTGHDRGTITINLAEADAGLRESMREQMNEAYRTLLGHFRHEIGHYYWDLLIRGGDYHNEFRALFGDESQDYRQALDAHYRDGPPWDWSAQFVSAYASSHPWEDWAESWAHYMHMVDTLDTAHANGFVLDGQSVTSPLGKAPAIGVLPWIHSFDDFVLDWGRLTVAMNALNRSMGLSDAYPFALSNLAVDKLAFVHRVIEDQRDWSGQSAR